MKVFLNSKHRKDMKQATRFYCTSITDATDRSNLYYIASPSATGITKDATKKQITVTGKKGNPLAIFAY